MNEQERQPLKCLDETFQSPVEELEICDDSKQATNSETPLLKGFIVFN